MTFAREKRLLLGWLALLAPLPLPFNEVLEWPALFFYLLVVIHFLGRADDPSRGWLDNRALNGLGLLYLPILSFDVWYGSQHNQLVTPLLHLTLFVLLVKLFSVRQEKEKWHVLLATFFVFVAAMATSSNIAVAIYLLGGLCLGLLALARLSELHMLAALGLGEQAEGPAKTRLAGLPRPRRGAFWGLLAVVVLAVPIFAALPRLSQPFLTGAGSGNLAMGRVSGFSDEASLDFTGAIRTRREIAMRLRFSQRIDRPEELRFKGAAYDVYRDRRWLRDNDLYDDLRPQDSRFLLGEGQTIWNALVFLEPLQSASLLVPSETLAVSFDGGPSKLYRDGGGGLIFPYSGRRRDTIEFQVELGLQPNISGKLGTSPGGGEAALDTSSISPRIGELARQVMGDGPGEEKILRLERFFLNEYGYTLDISDEGGDPIEDFLFVKKVGHCEYFATAMVLMLRSQGIPARFVTGFLGAEPNSLEDLHVVRQSNAHAWVEAYTPERGWQIYDPTPPSGRPGITRGGFDLWARQVYEYMAFRWDRYVLTYGAEDQGDLREGLAAFFGRAFDQLKGWLGLGSEDAPLPESASAPAAPEVGAAGSPATVAQNVPALVSSLLVVLLGAALLWWRRPPQTATAVYLALRQRLEAAELGVSPATPPLELQRLVGELAPAAAPAGDRLIRLYLAESFGGRRLADADRRELPDLRRSLEEALRQGLAERRRAAARLDRAR